MARGGSASSLRSKPPDLNRQSIGASSDSSPVSGQFVRQGRSRTPELLRSRSMTPDSGRAVAAGLLARETTPGSALVPSGGHSISSSASRSTAMATGVPSSFSR
jgi:hypothetical protein